MWRKTFFCDDNEEEEEDVPDPLPDSDNETMGCDASAPMAAPAVSPVVALNPEEVRRQKVLERCLALRVVYGHRPSS